MKKEELIKKLKKKGLSNNIINAISQIKRSNFIPKDIPEEMHYENTALPIGYNQTISQPFTIGYMLELSEIKPGNKVLEIGAGSGYNSAIISKLVKDNGIVYSLEIIPELAEIAKKNLKKENIKNVEVICKNGYDGLNEYAPYNRIIVTAGSEDIPEKLIEQLDEDGIMIIPVKNNNIDIMTKIVNTSRGLKITEHGQFMFVKFQRGNV